MAQISYGTITITDTNDIERVYPVYCKGGETTAPPLQPLTNWSETVSQAGGTGDYIWQRIVAKKQGLSVTADDYSDAVRLTGDSGSSLTITSIQYAQTQGENDTPSYSNSMPSSINEGWWLWVKTTYSDGSPVVTKIKQGQKGDTGQRGTSILKITTAPTTYTTTQGGFTPAYRISLSTVKTQSGKSEVLVGDIIEYNSNHYKVGYVDNSYVYLSAATSIKGSDGQTYYTWIKYAPNSNPTNAQISDSPTNMTYIGIYTGTTTPAPSTASSYAPWMKYIGTDGSPGVSVTGSRELYYLKTNSTNPSQITWNSSTSQPSTTIYSDDRTNAWTSIVPSYIDNSTYYTCVETSLSNSTKTWSAPVVNNALTNTNANALNAWIAAGAAELKVKKVINNSSGVTVASGINGGDITEDNTSTYGYNTIMAPNYLGLRYNDINLAKLTTTGSIPALEFYTPTVNGNGIPVQGNKGLSIDESSLRFYDSSGTIKAFFGSDEIVMGQTLTLAGNNNNIVDSSGNQLVDSSGNSIVDFFAEGVNSEGYNTRIDANGFYVRDGLTVLAEYGQTVTIGREESGSLRTKIDSDTFWITDGTTDFAFIGNENREITDTFISDGTTTDYTLSATYTSGGTFSPSTVIGTKISGENKIRVTSGLPAADETFSYTYTPTGLIKYYTMGTRNTSKSCGEYSFAEGFSSTASGRESHCEGFASTASGNYSHAEGQGTTASGYCAHAEGQDCVAAGNYSHAEGNSSGAVNCAHAEGYMTLANGHYSHTQNRRTRAHTRSQTVIGEFNKEDGSANSDHSQRGTYAFIIGNGASQNFPSNAFTVGWDGSVKIAENTPIVVETITEDNIDINAGSIYTWTKTLSKTGYTPVGIVGFRVSNATSGGTQSSLCNVYYWDLTNSTTLTAQIRNVGSASSGSTNTYAKAVVKLTAKILWISNGLI